MMYNKRPLTTEAQVAQLRNKGLIIADEEQAKAWLSNISYYRLRAYTYPFQDNENPTHPFKQELRFEQIIELYQFDCRLRMLVLKAIEKIEIALRTRIIYEWALTHGSHWYCKPELYRNWRYDELKPRIEREVGQSSEIFIKHYNNTYTEPEMPPSWMALEVVSFGTLSKLYSSLQASPEKIAVCQYFGLQNKYRILENWLHSFTDIRNICAHHGRLWNRIFTNKTDIPKHHSKAFIRYKKDLKQNMLYINLCSMEYLLKIISPQDSMKNNLRKLMKTCPLRQQPFMDFPVNWASDRFWR